MNTNFNLIIVYFTSVIFEVQIPTIGNKQAKKLFDEDPTTFVTLRRPLVSNSVTTMKMDVPAEGTTEFYVNILHGQLQVSYSEWLSMYVTTSGVQPQYGHQTGSVVTRMKVCELQAADHVSTRMTCVCLQACSVIVHVKFDAVQTLEIGEIQLLRELPI